MRISKRLTRKQAIIACKELWNNIDARGESKKNYLWEHHTKYRYDCPLCEWVMQGKVLGTMPENYNPVTKQYSKVIHCLEWKRVCPLVTQFNDVCNHLGYDDYSLNTEFIKVIKNLKVE